MQETILITGGSGLVGSRLTEMLMGKGYVVRHISRTRNLGGAIPRFKWDLEKGEWDSDVINGVNHIIHLAGSGVADGRWTDKRRKEILNSRVLGSQLVCEMVQASDGGIQSVVSSSAVGYYGIRTGEEIRTESDEPGKDFLANVCVQWEEAIASCSSHTNVTLLRTGIVLSKKGGALPKMALPVKLGVGSPLGTGKQPMPWIHIDDLCQMYIYAIEKKLTGAYNASCPEPVSNKIFTKRMAKVLNRKILLPNVPAFILKLLFGNMSQVLLTGVNVSTEKIASKGFVWQFPKLESALEDIYN